ncbi:MAG: recombinase family protein [Solirubrobacteraceae bacterium]
MAADRGRSPARARGATGGLVLDGYVRVSQRRGREGDSFQSPTLQRGKIEQWAALHGHQIAKVWEEIDESGRRADRPMLVRALERVEAGETDGIVVARLDRFSRSLLDALADIRRIKESNGTFVSVDDAFDLSSETGSLVLNVMLALAQFEVERITAGFSEARANAVARGLHPSARVPIGYLREPGTPLTVDPVAGPIVSELFQRRAAGDALVALTRFAEERELGAPRRWTSRAIKEVVRNRVYLGESRHGEFVNPTAHEALTDPLTFDRAQHHGRSTPAVSRGEPSPLASLIRCAGCRYGMATDLRGRGTGRAQRRYSCHRKYPSGECSAPAYLAGAVAVAVEAHVVEAFFASVGEVAAQAEQSGGVALAELETEAERAHAAVENLVADSATYSAVGPERFAAMVQRWQDQAHEAELAALREREQVGAWTPERVTTLREEWDNFEVGEQRQLLATVIDAVFVFRGPRATAATAHERIHICWRGEAPADMPSRGRRPSGPPTRFVRP